MNKLLIVVISTLVFILSCKSDPKVIDNSPAKMVETKKDEKPAVEVPQDEAPAPPVQELTPATAAETISTTTTLVPKPGEVSVEMKKGANFFKEIFKWKTGILIDMKYATTDNFTKKKIYDCGKCFLRPEAADALVKVHNDLKENHGYGLKVFDCFRPRPYQQRLWDIVPNPDYVTPPHKGSMHSRGLAVDLTIVDDKGKDLDMGTPFDFFGKEAHTDYKGHSAEINNNRELLKSTMEKYGFKGIRTEWWHYSIAVKYPLDEWTWQCK